ncbi:Ig-like domain-containing protein [Stenotrophomonas sp.]|uniref:Ig-like domain-containing protein n=1 Tax=Stenotrophomonas sp. TaxID=69392 RepID=UPI0028A7CEF0|nr:Ig-like domain-containing protein [Stenotrophomonas sp.]
MNKDLRAVDGGKAVRIKAISGGKYLLSEDGGAAPENITVKRIGKNLHVALEGTDPDQAELIIEGFFDHPGELIGQAEDGAYYAYVAVDGDTDSAAAFLLDGVSSPLALGFPALVGFGEGLVVAGGLLPAALAGLGALVGGAIVDHNRGGGKVVPKPVPDNNGIDSIVDDKGPHKGVVDNGGLTDDNQPTLSGSGQRPGDKIVISDNGKVIGDAVVNEKGEWTFTPDAALPDGKHVFDVIVVNPEGNSSGPSDKVEIVIDTTPPGKPSIGSVDDNEGSITGPVDNGGSTDDRQPTLSGKGDAGDTVTIIDNGKVIGEVPVGKDGNWSFTPELPLDEGEHAFDVVITDPAGNSSESSDEYVVVIDLTPPAKPGAGEAVLSDNEGQVTGPIVNGTVTDDNTPTFTGKSDEKNGTVVIYDGPDEIGRVPTDADGNWSFTPTPGLKDGEHTLQYEVIDTAGNVGLKSDGITFEVNTKGVAVKIDGADDNAGGVTGPISAGGVTDDTTPTVHGTATAGGTVKLYEGSTLLGSTVADAKGNWSITPGTALGEGQHSLTATVTTVANGESKKSGAFDFEIDLTAPGKPTIEQVYDDVGMPSGALSQGQSTDDTTPTLSGKAEKGSTVLIYDNGSLLGDVVADANGNWSFTPTTPLLNDTHSFEVKAKDKAGNLSEASDPFVIVVDTVPPGKPVIETVFDDQGNQTGYLNSGDTTDDSKPVITGKAEPNSTVIIKDNGVEIGRAPVNAEGVWTFEPTLPLGLADHKLTAHAVDAAGNIGAASNAFDLTILNPNPPAAPAITAVIDDVGSKTGNVQKNEITDDARPTIKGTAEPGVTVTIYIDGKPVGTAVAQANGDWNYTPGSNLVDGLHTITATATNGLGNVSKPTGDYPIVVDTVPPGVGSAVLSDNEGQVTGPIVNGTVTDDNTPTFTGKSDEKNGTVVIYDGPDEIGRVPTDADGNWSFTPTPGLKDGEHTLQYEVIDTAGNVGLKSDGITFEVNTKGVAVKIDGADDNAGGVTGPISAGGVTDDTTPTVHGTATAGGTVKLYEGSTLLGSTVADAKGNWSITPGTALGEGQHSLTATVTTVANGESKKSGAFDFEIDLTAPGKPTIEQVYDDVGMPSGALSQGQSTDDTTPTLSGKAEKGSTVLIYDNGSLLGDVVADANGNWSFTPTTPLLNDTHSFEVKAKDKAGNLSEASDPFVIVVDTVPPGKPVIETVFDDQGNQTGYLNSGDTTDDSKPVITGKAEPNSTVIIKDNGVEIGRAPVNAEGVWTFEPTLPLGLADHKLTAHAVDAAGNIGAASNAFDLTILNPNPPAAPAITAVIDDVGSKTGNVQKNEITDDARPTIKGTAEPGVTVTIYIDGKPVGTAVAQANGDWNYTPGSNLVDGLHTITATATNGLGNVSKPTGDYPIVVDTVPPGVGSAVLSDNEGQVTGPIVNGTVTDDNTPTFTGKSDEKNGTVVIYDGPDEIGRVPTDADGNWSFTPTPGLKDGEHTLQYEVIDTAGNVGLKSDGITFEVNTKGVAVKIDGADDNAGGVTGPISAGGVTDDTTPTVHGTATAGGTVKLYEGSTLLGSTVADAKGNWSITPGTALGEGQHSLTATVTTVANGESKKSGAFDFEIDLTAPGKPTIEQVYDDVGMPSGALSQGQSTDDTTPTLSGKAEKGSTVLIYDNGSLLGDVVADANGNWSFTPTTPLLNDTHSFEVKAKDKAGNLSEASDPFVIVVDTIPPAKPTIESVHDDAGAITGDVANGGTTDDTTPTLRGTAEAGSTVIIMSNGNKIGEAIADSLGNWVCTPEGALIKGEHGFTAISVDEAGNRSGASNAYTVNINFDPPSAVATILSMGKDSGASNSDWLTCDAGAGRIMQGSLSSELGSHERLQVSTDGGVTWKDASVDGKSWAAVDALSHDTGWEIQTRVIDNDGRKGPVTSQTVVLDQVPPDAPVSVKVSGTTVSVGLSNGVSAGDQLDFVSNGKRYQHTLTAEEVSAGVVVVTVPAAMTTNLHVGVVDAAGNMSDYRGASLTGSETFDFNSYKEAQSFGTVFSSGTLTVTCERNIEIYDYISSGNGTPSLWIGRQAPGHVLSEFDLSQPAVGISLNFYAESSKKDIYFAFFDANGEEIGRVNFPSTGYEQGGVVSFKAPEGKFISSFVYATPGVDGNGTLIDDLVIDRNGVPGGLTPPALVQSIVGDAVAYHGGKNDNIFELADANNFDVAGLVIHGGSGVDTLKLTGKGSALDLAVAKGAMSSVEIIDIDGTGNNTLSLGLSDVLNNGASNQFYAGDMARVQMMVKGSAGDVVNLRDLLSGGQDYGDWAKAGVVTIAGAKYVSYQHSSLGAELLVSQDILVNLDNVRTAQGVGVSGMDKLAVSLEAAVVIASHDDLPLGSAVHDPSGVGSFGGSAVSATGYHHGNIELYSLQHVAYEVY